MSRARQELNDYANSLDVDAELLERYVASKRGNNEAECEAVMCRIEAQRVRREIGRWQ